MVELINLDTDPQLDDSCQDLVQDRLSLKRVEGGNFIWNPPLFSENEEVLFIIRQPKTVCAYSTNTGEWMCDLDEPTESLVGIHNMPNDTRRLIGCTESGDIVTWKHKSGVIENKVKINFPAKGAVVKVGSFNIISLDASDELLGLITWTYSHDAQVQICIFDLRTGNLKKTVNMKLKQDKGGDHKVAVSEKTVAVIQNNMLFVSNYRNQSNRFSNAGRMINTAVACHPKDETVAVGDETGKIFLYFNLYSTKIPTTKLCHWHHNPVNTICFSASGSRLYSGGDERVLVVWDYLKMEKINTLPRCTGNIVHIVLSSRSTNIAFATDDNGIQIVDSQLNQISVVQNFVRVAHDKTPWPLFPFGLKLDPRTGNIVLNGRAGHIQFYSTDDGRVFSLNTTNENCLSLEQNRILYNTRVTHIACAMHWLVTAESLNDLERFPEIRLKFWKFDTTLQTYVLNTHIESPHEGGVTALEFSSSSSVNNLLCASGGLDKCVKIWSLEESKIISTSSPLDTIDNDSEQSAVKETAETRMCWNCLKTTSYKDLSVNSLVFSQDGSLLCVGFGNTLCIYIPETLRLKCVLSPPSGQCGSANKLIINMSAFSSKAKPAKKERMRERRTEIVQLVKDFLENDDEKLLTKLTEKTKKSVPRDSVKVDPSTMTLAQKEIIFDEILANNELQLYQKLELFQKIGIQVCLPPNLKHKYDEYIRWQLSLMQKEDDLMSRTKDLGSNAKFILQNKLQNYLRSRGDIAPDCLYIRNVTFNDKVETRDNARNGSCQSMEIDKDTKSATNSIRKVMEIKHVVFATGEFSYFVIVCTQNRLLIWNLKTLQLHASLKLSVRHIVVDPCTSLIAAFTFYEELYIFQPNNLYALYERKDMPKIEGAIWLPRRHPKQQSLDVNWQSQSQLYFLTREQELQLLVDESDDEFLTRKATSLKQVFELKPQTPFSAMIPQQITNDSLHKREGVRFGEYGKDAIQSIINLQTHTMPPVSSLAWGVLKSLLPNTRHNLKESDKQEPESGEGFYL
ncbi:WD repeat-containing protein 75 [Pseudolycoriella hygida]|uniref:WD repeat-containing protein 75 n=1 Tax=Pseudolycoriella hygida TaxID=35572 RepID=A0A9Q0NEG3_9DIPT|nr:WD repeat-containing protein 75 [Pseudolycoriella hygida]